MQAIDVENTWGATLGGGEGEFRVWAPAVKRLRLRLNGDEHGMKVADGWWRALLPARAGDRYSFILDDGSAVPDPAARAMAGGLRGEAVAVDSRAYRWQHEEWRGRPWAETVISEVHVGTFTEAGTFRAAIERLPALAEVGITAVELMPVAQFEGARGWGYDGVLLYAPHDAYGTPDDLRALVDAAHGLGLMVFLDVVYNHFGPEGNPLPRLAPAFFRAERHTPWGVAIAYERPAVRRFFIDNALMWLEEYRFDGLRFDAADHIRDEAAEEEILIEMAREIRTRFPDREVHLATEDNRNIVGLHPWRDGRPLLHTAEWNDDLHNVAHVIATGETEGYYVDFAEHHWEKYARALAEGFAYQGEVSRHEGGRPRGEASAGQPPLAFVDFLQNHDQVGNRAFGERLTTLASEPMLRGLTAVLLLSPHVPLLFMGQEWGETRPFVYFTDFEGELAQTVRDGRRREFGRFTAFRDEAARATIPDPNDPGSFVASRIDWAARESAAGRDWLGFTRRLLEVRQREVVPHLGRAPGHGGRVLAADQGLVAVDWRLDGATLRLRANLSDVERTAPEAAGRAIWGRAGGPLPAFGVLATVEEGMSPRATYRLQFGPGFGFAEAAALAPYLAALGVSHVYLAPVFAARPGSTHGYDVTDPGAINPELGGEAGFRAMAAAFRAEGLGILLDIVPNHMGIGGAGNRFWLDVLAWGRESRFAGWFDIDWEAGGGKVLVPVLGEVYGPALAAGALELRFEDGQFSVWAHGTHRLPVSPRHWGWILRVGGLAALAMAAEALDGAPAADPGWVALVARLAKEPEAGGAVAAFREPAALDGLIAAQAWRPTKFSLDRDALNYRRFFAISDLAGLRIEEPAVFEATQRLALALVDEGTVDGLRVDHIDGLRDPRGYLRRLRAGAARPFWLLVEKILAEGEVLPEDWGVDGTTGYEVANLLVGLLVDPGGEAAMTRVYRDFTGRGAAPQAVVRQAKREAVERMLGSELAALTARLLRLAERSGRFCDLGGGAVRVALVETIAALGVYRTYADAAGIGTGDRARVEAAVAAARRAAAWVEPDAFALVEAVLTLDEAEWPEEGAAVLEAALRFQQLSGPAMAKGLEDTALYRYNRLIALNEVGSEPGRFGTPLAAFHAANAERLAKGALGLLGTSTHDTKRGEDARARIAALPRHAAAWEAAVGEWHALLADQGAPIDRNDEYFFYQLLVGAWPMEWREEPGAGALAALAERVQAAMLKSVREAGENTRWVFGDADYEARLAGFIGRALAPGGAYLRSFRAFEATLAPDGAANGLIQAALKLTLPGVPDVYRGAEAWEQSLVDPDNRRPVDFGDLARRLVDLPTGAAAFSDWTSPTAKLALTARLLAARREQPALFAAGSYEPVEPGTGICGFRRRHKGVEMLVLAALRHGGTATRVDLDGTWTDMLTGATLKGGAGVFAALPVAVLLRG